MDYQIIFLTDSCINARTRGAKRACARFVAHAHFSASCARIYARIFKKIVMVVHYYLRKIQLLVPEILGKNPVLVILRHHV